MNITSWKQNRKKINIKIINYSKKNNNIKIKRRAKKTKRTITINKYIRK